LRHDVAPPTLKRLGDGRRQTDPPVSQSPEWLASDDGVDGDAFVVVRLELLPDSSLELLPVLAESFG
jgi:hypothetical protein